MAADFCANSPLSKRSEVRTFRSCYLPPRENPSGADWKVKPLVSFVNQSILMSSLRSSKNIFISMDTLFTFQYSQPAEYHFCQDSVLFPRLIAERIDERVTE